MTVFHGSALLTLANQPLCSSLNLFFVVLLSHHSSFFPWHMIPNRILPCKMAPNLWTACLHRKEGPPYQPLVLPKVSSC